MQAALALCLRQGRFPKTATYQLLRSHLLSTGAEGVDRAAPGSVNEQLGEPFAQARGTSGLAEQQQQQERLQRQQHDNRLQRRRAVQMEEVSDNVRGLSGYMVRVVRLGCAITRRDVRRFFKDFDITDANIRPQYHWGSNAIKAYWVFFKTEQERQRALDMTGRHLGPYPAMLLREEDPQELYKAMQKAPGASHSRGRVVLVENLSPSTSLSGLLRPFEGFHLQEHAATLLETSAAKSDDGPLELRDKWTSNTEARLPTKAMQHRKPGEAKPEPKPSKKARAIVRFKTTEEAHRAVRQLNNTYVTNDCVRMRVLH